jgi:hypothetical protein
MAAEITYFDENDIVVGKEDAVRAIAVETDAAGNILKEVFVDL